MTAILTDVKSRLHDRPWIWWSCGKQPQRCLWRSDIL